MRASRRHNLKEGYEREDTLSRRGITALTQIHSIKSSPEIEIERERGEEGRVRGPKRASPQALTTVSDTFVTESDSPIR